LSTFYEKRQLVLPGDLLAEGDFLANENTYKEGNKIYATRIGLVDYDNKKIYVVALKSFYIPAVGDTVIGRIIEVGLSSWTIDINAPYLATLRASDVMDRSFKPRKDELPSIFDVSDLVIAKIVSYDRTCDPLLTVKDQGLGKISKGQVIEITPTKIPRVIGRKGSMVNIIKEGTGCQIIIGQNGLILINGKTPEDEVIAIMAIRKIEEEAHTSGLTDRITELIRRKKEEEKHG